MDMITTLVILSVFTICSCNESCIEMNNDYIIEFVKSNSYTEYDI